MMIPNHRMVVVSNRLPVTIEKTPGGFAVEPSSGGLVTALRPLLNDCAGTWIGWTGTDSSTGDRARSPGTFASKAILNSSQSS